MISSVSSFVGAQPGDFSGGLRWAQVCQRSAAGEFGGSASTEVGIYLLE